MLQSHRFFSPIHRLHSRMPIHHRICSSSSNGNVTPPSREDGRHEDASHSEVDSVASSSSTPAALQSIDSNDMIPEGFTRRRLLCFTGIVVAYMGLYFTRGSLTYTAPILLADPSMAVSLTDIGLMTSAFPLAYGISKFLGGVLGAKFSSSLMLAGGLVLTTIINLLFGLTNSVQLWTALWFLNGSIQGIGAPASAALLTRWFASKERGTWWGLWNCGANLGGFMTPILVAKVAHDFGWRWGMWGPAIIGGALALFGLFAIKESPEEAGFVRSNVIQAASNHTAISLEAREKTANATAATLKKDGGRAIRAALISTLQNPGIWLLAFTYFCVYILRQGATSWLCLLLIQEKGASDASQAAQLVSGLELGGLVGGTLAGMWSDSRIRGAKSDDGTGLVGLRIQIVMAYIVGSIGILYLLSWLPASSPNELKWLVIAMLGFTIYGPQMLIGLCGAELVSKGAVGASQGFLGLVAYIGAANAGVPLSLILKTYGWSGYFIALSVACCCAFFLLIPLVNAKSFAQTDSRGKSA